MSSRQRSSQQHVQAANNTLLQGTWCPRMEQDGTQCLEELQTTMLFCRLNGAFAYSKLTCSVWKSSRQRCAPAKVHDAHVWSRMGCRELCAERPRILCL
eukprot:836446-Pelagomonas_calceolata.AAC.2